LYDLATILRAATDTAEYAENIGDDMLTTQAHRIRRPTTLKPLKKTRANTWILP
jgi:hypothetical protein